MRMYNLQELAGLIITIPTRHWLGWFLVLQFWIGSSATTFKEKMALPYRLHSLPMFPQIVCKRGHICRQGFAEILLHFWGMLVRSLWDLCGILVSIWGEVGKNILSKCIISPKQRNESPAHLLHNSLTSETWSSKHSRPSLVRQKQIGNWRCHAMAK